MVERTAWSRELHGMKNRTINRPHPVGYFNWCWIFKVKTMFSEEWWREQWSAGTPKSWGSFHCPFWWYDNVMHHCSGRIHVERQKNHQWSRGSFEKIEMHVKDAKNFCLALQESAIQVFWKEFKFAIDFRADDTKPVNSSDDENTALSRWLSIFLDLSRK